MAGPALAARAILSWALRGTKLLSPEKAVRTTRLTAKGLKPGFLAKKSTKLKTFTAAHEPRDWMKKFAYGDKSILGKLSIGEKGRGKFVSSYTKSYKHLRKHKKLYGAGGAGAAIWDFLPGKDNPKA